MPISAMQHRNSIGIRKKKRSRARGRRVISNEFSMPDEIRHFSEQVIQAHNVIKSSEGASGIQGDIKRNAVSKAIHLILLLNHIQPARVGGYLDGEGRFAEGDSSKYDAVSLNSVSAIGQHVNNTHQWTSSTQQPHKTATAELSAALESTATGTSTNWMHRLTAPLMATAKLISQLNFPPVVSAATVPDKGNDSVAVQTRQEDTATAIEENFLKIKNGLKRYTHHALSEEGKKTVLLQINKDFDAFESGFVNNNYGNCISHEMGKFFHSYYDNEHHGIDEELRFRFSNFYMRYVPSVWSRMEDFAHVLYHLPHEINNENIFLCSVDPVIEDMETDNDIASFYRTNTVSDKFYGDSTFPELLSKTFPYLKDDRAKEKACYLYRFLLSSTSVPEKKIRFLEEKMEKTFSASPDKQWNYMFAALYRLNHNQHRPENNFGISRLSDDNRNSSDIDYINQWVIFFDESQDRMQNGKELRAVYVTIKAMLSLLADNSKTDSAEEKLKILKVLQNRAESLDISFLAEHGLSDFILFLAEIEIAISNIENRLIDDKNIFDELKRVLTLPSENIADELKLERVLEVCIEKIKKDPSSVTEIDNDIYSSLLKSTFNTDNDKVFELLSVLETQAAVAFKNILKGIEQSVQQNMSVVQNRQKITPSLKKMFMLLIHHPNLKGYISNQMIKSLHNIYAHFTTADHMENAYHQLQPYLMTAAEKIDALYTEARDSSFSYSEELINRLLDSTGDDLFADSTLSSLYQEKGLLTVDTSFSKEIHDKVNRLHSRLNDIEEHNLQLALTRIDNISAANLKGCLIFNFHSPQYLKINQYVLNKIVNHITAGTLSEDEVSEIKTLLLKHYHQAPIAFQKEIIYFLQSISPQASQGSVNVPDSLFNKLFHLAENHTEIPVLLVSANSVNETKIFQHAYRFHHTGNRPVSFTSDTEEDKDSYQIAVKVIQSVSTEEKERLQNVKNRQDPAAVTAMYDEWITELTHTATLSEDQESWNTLLYVTQRKLSAEHLFRELPLLKTPDSLNTASPTGLITSVQAYAIRHFLTQDFSVDTTFLNAYTDDQLSDFFSNFLISIKKEEAISPQQVAVMMRVLNLASLYLYYFSKKIENAQTKPADLLYSGKNHSDAVIDIQEINNFYDDYISASGFYFDESQFRRSNDMTSLKDFYQQFNDKRNNITGIMQPSVRHMLKTGGILQLQLARKPIVKIFELTFSHLKPASFPAAWGATSVDSTNVTPYRCYILQTDEEQKYIITPVNEGVEPVISALSHVDIVNQLCQDEKLKYPVKKLIQELFPHHDPSIRNLLECQELNTWEGKSVESLLETVVQENLIKFLDLLKETKRDHAWYEHILNVLPFFQVIQRSIHDPHYTPGPEELIFDIIDVVMTLATFGYSLATDAFIKGIKAGLAAGRVAGLIGTTLRRYAIKVALKKAGVISKKAIKDFFIDNTVSGLINLSVESISPNNPLMMPVSLGANMLFRPGGGFLYRQVKSKTGVTRVFTGQPTDKARSGNLYRDGAVPHYVIKEQELPADNGYVNAMRRAEIEQNAELFNQRYGKNSAEIYSDSKGTLYTRMVQLPGKPLSELKPGDLPKHAKALLEKNMQAFNIDYNNLELKHTLWDEATQTFYFVKTKNNNTPLKRKGELQGDVIGGDEIKSEIEMTKKLNELSQAEVVKKSKKHKKQSSKKRNTENEVSLPACKKKTHNRVKRGVDCITAVDFLKTVPGYDEGQARSLLSQYHFPENSIFFSEMNFVNDIKNTEAIPGWAEIFKLNYVPAPRKVKEERIIDTIIVSGKPKVHRGKNPKLTVALSDKKLSLGRKIRTEKTGDVYADASDNKFVIKEVNNTKNKKIAARQEVDDINAINGDGSAKLYQSTIESKNYYIRTMDTPGVPISEVKKFPSTAPEEFKNLLDYLESEGIILAGLDYRNIYWDHETKRFFIKNPKNIYSQYYSASANKRKHFRNVYNKDKVVAQDMIKARSTAVKTDEKVPELRERTDKYGLNKDEIGALQVYTATGSEWINWELYTNAARKQAIQDHHIYKTIPFLDSALDRLPRKKGTFYRIGGAEELAWLRNQITDANSQIGNNFTPLEVTFQTYLSTSGMAHVPGHKFPAMEKDTPMVRYVIHGKNRAHPLPVKYVQKDLSYENEILFERGTTFRITKCTEKTRLSKNNKRATDLEVEMEETGGDPADIFIDDDDVSL